MWKSIDLVKWIRFPFNSSNSSGVTGVVTDLQDGIATCDMGFLCEGRGQATVIFCASVSPLPPSQSCFLL